MKLTNTSLDTAKKNRLDNFSFIISFRHSHRIPLFEKNANIKCPCNKPIDIYGDNFLTCIKHSKKTTQSHMLLYTFYYRDNRNPCELHSFKKKHANWKN